MSSIKSRKAKARRLQNKIREMILEAYPILKEGDVDVAIMGEGGIDIPLSPFAETLVPFDIEAKNQEKLNIWKALEQAEYNTKEDRLPLVVFKRNRSNIYACLKFEDLLCLLTNIKEKTEQSSN